MLLAPRISRGFFFLAGFFRVSLDGLSERGTTQSLPQRGGAAVGSISAALSCRLRPSPGSFPKQRLLTEPRAAALQLPKILKFLGQSADDLGKSTRGENVLKGSQGQACGLLHMKFVLSKES